MFTVTPDIQIPESEFEFSFARSSGPGGQNVNKVNSKALLHWNITKSGALPLGARARFFARYGNQVTTEGYLLVTSDRFRDQIRNREDCLVKLREMLQAIAVAPKPRRKTKPSRSSIEKQKNNKRRHGEKKRGRGRVGSGE